MYLETSTPGSKLSTSTDFEGSTPLPPLRPLRPLPPPTTGLTTFGKAQSCHEACPKFQLKRSRCSPSMSNRVCATIVPLNWLTEALRFSQERPARAREVSMGAMGLGSTGVIIQRKSIGMRVPNGAGACEQSGQEPRGVNELHASVPGSFVEASARRVIRAKSVMMRETTLGWRTYPEGSQRREGVQREN